MSTCVCVLSYFTLFFDTGSQPVVSDAAEFEFLLPQHPEWWNDPPVYGTRHKSSAS